MFMGAIEGLMLLLVAGGGGGGILGMPPGERDTTLMQCPPKQVILYSEWAGRGKGKPGAPGVEGFAADPEVLSFIAAFKKGIHDSINRNEFRNKEDQIISENITPLVFLALNRSGCFYLDADAKTILNIMANPPELPRFTPPFVGFLPGVRATLILNGGDQAEEMAKHITALCNLMPESEQTENLQHQKFPIPLENASLTLHRHKNYFILGWGKGTVDEALKGLKGESQGLKDDPRFLAGMEKVALERTGSVVWFDLKSLVDKAVKGLGPQGLIVAAMVKQLGLDSVESLALCTGIVEGQVHTRGFLKTGGKTEGVLALAAGRPLTPKDFQHVPGDADLALGFTLDFPRVLKTARTIIAQAGDQPKEGFDRFLAQLEMELGGLSLENEFFKAFGNAWVLYDSPANGGILATAPVLSVDVTDHDKAKIVLEKLMNVLKNDVLRGERQTGRFRRGEFLEKKTFLDHDIYYVNIVGNESPFSVSFLLTETHLLAATNPQHLKGHLRFLKAKEENFSAKFQEKFPHSGEMFAACYTDPQLFTRYFVAVSPIMSSLMFGEIQREMRGFDMFDFPSARAFLPYLGEGFLIKERTEDGILFNSRSGVPVPGASAMVMTIPMMGFFFISSSSREFERTVPREPKEPFKEDAKEGDIELNQVEPKRPLLKPAVRKVAPISAS